MDSSAIWFIIIPILVGIGIILQLRSGRRTNYDYSRDNLMRRHRQADFQRFINQNRHNTNRFMDKHR